MKKELDCAFCRFLGHHRICEFCEDGEAFEPYDDEPLDTCDVTDLNFTNDETDS